MWEKKQELDEGNIFHCREMGRRCEVRKLVIVFWFFLFEKWKGRHGEEDRWQGKVGVVRLKKV